MNSLTRIMSYDKTKNVNQENCNCDECTNVKVENLSLIIRSISSDKGGYSMVVFSTLEVVHSTQPQTFTVPSMFNF